MRIIIAHNNGMEIQVDDADYERCSVLVWGARRDRKTGIWYALTTIGSGRTRTTSVLLHRFILQLPKRWPLVDHQDRNGLNCQRSNMRIATQSQNMMNSRKRLAATLSKYKGVTRVSTETWGKWMARISHNRRLIYLGCFASEVEAANAYDAKAVELFGDFARLNFPKSGQRKLRISDESVGFLIRGSRFNSVRALQSFLSATQTTAVAALESDATVASIGFRLATAALVMLLLAITWGVACLS